VYSKQYTFRGDVFSFFTSYKSFFLVTGRRAKEKFAAGFRAVESTNYVPRFAQGRGRRSLEKGDENAPKQRAGQGLLTLLLAKLFLGLSLGANSGCDEHPPELFCHGSLTANSA